jgi:glycosyltransferase involved in cell wall biosynthesis
VKTTFITTVLNEEKTIIDLLNSLNSQRPLPNEVAIVDGGSKDDTVSKILNFQKSKENKLKIKLIRTKGNRSVGRNTAIRNAKSEIIAISDAGCRLDKDWLEEITKPFQDKTIDVVAGYYKGNAKTSFQKAQIPYVLVMKPDPKNFLPSTRSMAIRRKVWEEIGGFNEKLSNNEDYVFAQKINQKGYKIHFAKKAIVSWDPRTNILDSYNMFYRFALGDAESGILRLKVLIIFIRYILGVVLLTLGFFNQTFLYLLLVLLFFYLVWAVLKNYKYVRDKSAFVYLPLLQFISDIAVLSGTIIGRI